MRVSSPAGRACARLLACCLFVFVLAAPASAQYTAPGQWHPVSELLLGTNDAYAALDSYIDAVRGLNGAAPVSIICSSSYVVSQLRYEFQAAGVNTPSVRYYTCALDSIWMRDYAPIFTQNASGGVYCVDARYYPERPNDDAFPYKFARFRGLGYTTIPLNYEGGNFMSDGRGRLFFSNDTYAENTQYSTTTVASYMKSRCGGTSVTTPTPLIDEGTGHIDMYAKLTSATRVVVADYPAGHRQKARVDAAATKFANLGITVVRAQMAIAEDEYATYANAVFVNGVALVPKYFRAQDAAGLAAYSAAGFRAAGVDCREVIHIGGAMHCICYGVPTPVLVR